MNYDYIPKNCNDLTASSTLSASMSQYGLAGKNKFVTEDKSRGMADNAAIVLQAQK